MIKKSALTLLVIVLNLSYADAQFRDFEWGTTKSEVVSELGKPALEEGDVIAYKGSIAGYDAYISYHFINDELHAGRYVFTDSHSNEMMYISDFKDVNSMLKKKYGDPEGSNSRIVLDYDMEDNEYIDEGTKLSSGAIGYESQWLEDNLILLHQLRGDNYEISHTLGYRSEEYDELKEKQNVSEF